MFHDSLVHEWSPGPKFKIKDWMEIIKQSIGWLGNENLLSFIQSSYFKRRIKAVFSIRGENKQKNFPRLNHTVTCE